MEITVISIFAIVAVLVLALKSNARADRARADVERMMHAEHETAMRQFESGRCREVQLAQELGEARLRPTVEAQLRVMHDELARIVSSQASLPVEVAAALEQSSYME